MSRSDRWMERDSTELKIESIESATAKIGQVIILPSVLTKNGPRPAESTLLVLNARSRAHIYQNLHSEAILLDRIDIADPLGGSITASEAVTRLRVPVPSKISAIRHIPHIIVMSAT